MVVAPLAWQESLGGSQPCCSTLLATSRIRQQSPQAAREEKEPQVLLREMRQDGDFYAVGFCPQTVIRYQRAQKSSEIISVITCRYNCSSSSCRTKPILVRNGCSN